MKIEDRIEAIVAAVFAAFMEGETDGITVREVAERIGASPAQVNSACSKSFNIERGWRRITPTDCYVDVHESNFNSVTHQRRCTGYSVTREFLRDKIAEATS